MANDRRRKSPPSKAREAHEAGEPALSDAQPVFEESSTLREPADPRGPRALSSRQAREATEELLHEILEESPAGTSEPEFAPWRPAPPPADEDWPSELHPLHFRGE